MSTAAASRRMPPLTLATNVQMMKGVGPQRAELLAQLRNIVRENTGLMAGPRNRYIAEPRIQ